MTQQLLQDSTEDQGRIDRQSVAPPAANPDRAPEESYSSDAITSLDVSHLVTENDEPVDNFQSAQQERLLVEPLYSCDRLPPPFLAEANVGLFYKIKGDPIVPDALLSLGVQRAEDYSQKQNRSYFVWEFGKVPDVCIEIVSNQEGNELTLSKKAAKEENKTCKKDIYAQIGIPYYVVFDPLAQIQGEREMNGAYLRAWMISPGGYTELTPPEGIKAVGQFVWLEAVGLGLTLWEGQYEEEVSRVWLRWCDQSGQVIPTGAEGQAIERDRADAERERAEAERERAEAERERAEAERERAEAESQRAEAERQRAEKLADRLRALGIDPDAV